MTKKVSLLLIIVGVLFAACFKQEVVPPLIFDGEANMTIAEFQQLHELSATNPPTLIDTNAIITGVVTSTDQFGSCYKEIYFQDETGGLCIRTASTSYYAKYRIGQRIYVKAKNLYLGNYVSGSRYGFYQIGLYGNTNGGMEYISSTPESQHVFRSGFPETPPDPKIITGANDIKQQDFHTLVQLTNCYFQDANGSTKFFETSGTSTTISRVIRFNAGSGAVEARISAYCNFAKNILPQGPLNVTGLLTLFGSLESPTYQLIIRSIDDVIAPKVLKTFDMSTDPFLQGWKNEKIIGDEWAYNASAKIVTIAPAHTETECRLVSPKFDFSGEKNVALIFSRRLLNATSDNVQVEYTVDGNNWISLGFIPQSGSGWIEDGLKIDDHLVSNPNLQIAFHYKTTTVFPVWAIKNITFMGNVLY